MSEPVLAAVGLVKRYANVPALGGVSCDISAGETVCLIGPNGAGKTTLLSILAGVRDFDEGEVRWKGEFPSVGYAPQDVGTYPTATVAENLRYSCALMGVPRTARRSLIETAAEVLSLGPFLDRPAHALSGGERRRLHVAMATVHQPDVVLLDEPTAGVDQAIRDQVLALVADLAARGVGVVYSTHYFPEVDQIRGQVAVIVGGRIVAGGAYEELAKGEVMGGVTVTLDAGAEWARHLGRLDGDELFVPAADPVVALPKVVSELEALGCTMTNVRTHSGGVEAVYRRATKAFVREVETE